jgi:hypothetical protein
VIGNVLKAQRAIFQDSHRPDKPFLYFVGNLELVEMPFPSEKSEAMFNLQPLTGSKKICTHSKGTGSSGHLSACPFA